MRNRPSRQQIPTVLGLETRVVLSTAAQHFSNDLRHAISRHIEVGSYQGSLGGVGLATAVGGGGVETYQASGRINGSAATVTGGDTLNPSHVTRSSYRYQLTHGTMTLSDRQGDSLQVSYTGSGVARTRGTPHYAETMHGTARASNGDVYHFVGSASGRAPEVTAPGTIRGAFVLYR